MYAVWVTIIGLSEKSVYNVQYLLKKVKNESCEKVWFYWQFIGDKEQQMIEQVYINLFIFCLFLKV